MAPFPRRLLLALTLVPAPAAADWLVTRGGRVFETSGPWSVEGDQVVFIAAAPSTTLVIGSGSPASAATGPSATALYALPLAEVDFERSRRETERRASGPPRASGAVEHPRDRKAGGLPTASLPPASSPGGLEARERWELPRPVADRWEVQASVGGSRWDNLRRAPSGEEGPAVSATRTAARLGWKPSARVPLQGVVEAAETSYRSLPSSTSYGAGLRYVGRRHQVDVSSRFEHDRRALEVDEGFDAAEIVRHQARYSVRGRWLEWLLAGQRSSMEPEAGPARGGHLDGVDTSWLVRGFGRTFAPRVGAGWSRWHAEGTAGDYRERSYGLELRFSPGRRLAFSLGGERGDRDYLTEDVGERNFERRDRRDRWQVEADVLLTETILARLSWDRLEGDSTRAGRDFTAETLSVALVLRMGARGRPAPVPSEPILLASPPATAQLRGVDTRRVGDGVETTIVASGPIQYRVSQLSGPSRLVVDLVGVRSSAPIDVPIDTAAVARIRVAQEASGPRPLTRVTFLLNRPTSSELAHGGDRLVVRLAGAGG